MRRIKLLKVPAFHLHDKHTSNLYPRKNRKIEKYSYKKIWLQEQKNKHQILIYLELLNYTTTEATVKQ